MAENNVQDRPNIDVTGMSDGSAKTVVAVGQIINNNICAQCKQNIRAVVSSKVEQEGDDITRLITKQEHLFTESRSFMKAKETLEQKHVVVLTGAPEEGKTTLAVQLCNAFMTDQDYNGAYHIKPSKVNLSTIAEKNSITVFDNMFEESLIMQRTKKILSDIQEKVQMKQRKERPECLFIIVCQLFDMKKAEVQVQTTILTEEYYVNMSDINCSEKGDSWRERLFVLQKLHALSLDQGKIERGKHNMDREHNKIARRRPFFIGFPGMCAFYGTTNHNVSCFYYPHSFYTDQFKAVFKSDSDKTVLFIFLIFCGGKADMSKPLKLTIQNKLKTVNETFGQVTFEFLQNQVKYLTGTYLMTSEDEVVEFTYPVLYNACVAAIIEHDPEYILKHCHLKFCDDTENREEDDDIYPLQQENVISITKSVGIAITDHWVNMIRSRHFSDAMKNPVLQNQDYREELFRKLESDISSLIKTHDSVHNGNILFWSAESDNTAFTMHLMNHPAVSTTEISCSIFTCVKKNSVFALDALDRAVKESKRKDIKFNVDCTLESGETPLMLASKCSQGDLVNRLLQKGADLSTKDFKGQNCVHLAGTRDNLNIFQTLCKSVPRDVLDFEDSSGSTPTMLALEKRGHIYDYVLSHNDRIETRQHLYKNLEKEIIRLACKNDDDNEILGRLSKPQTLNGILSDGNTPVMLAAYHGSQKVFKLLVSEPACDVSVVNDDGCNILHNACIGGSEDIVQRIKTIVELNRVRNKKGRTPMMEAAEMGHWEVFKLLANKGCETSGQDQEGSSLLHIACMGGNADIVEHIMSQNMGDIKTRDCRGNVPVETASELGHHDVVKLFEYKKTDRHRQQEVDEMSLRLDAQTPRDERGEGGKESSKRSPPAIPRKPKVIKGAHGESTQRKPPPVPPKPTGVKDRTEGAETTERKLPQPSTPPQLPSTPTPLQTSSTLSSSPPSPLPSKSIPSTSRPPLPQPSTLRPPPPPPPPRTDIEERQDGSENPSQTDHVKPDETPEEGSVHTITVSESSHQVSCPAMTLHRDRVHWRLDVSEDGQELVNWRESGHHSDQFQEYAGTCSRLPIPLPPSPSTLTAPTYWETDTRVQVKREVSAWPLLQMGVSEEGQVDTESWVGDQSRGWGVLVTRCDKHPGFCTQVWSEDRQCGVCLTDTLTLTPGTDVSLKYGAVVDIGRGRLAFIDLNRGRVLHRFDVKIRESLRPIFCVWPWSDDYDVTMRLISGREITMDDNKKSLIIKALYSQ